MASLGYELLQAVPPSGLNAFKAELAPTEAPATTVPSGATATPKGTEPAAVETSRRHFRRVTSNAAGAMLVLTFPSTSVACSSATETVPEMEPTVATRD